MLPFLLLSTWAFQSSQTPTKAFASPGTNVKGTCFVRNNYGPIRAVTRDEPLGAHKVDLCIIGGGISGLSAAITAAEKSMQQSSKCNDNISDTPLSILLLESESVLGGRVRSDYTDDGFILDRGFAVFIEEYPQSKIMLDYDALDLKQFLPGAKVKLAGRDKLATVADPLRRRRDVFRAIASPVGNPLDKLRLLPLFYTVMTKSIEDLFLLEETDTLTCLKKTYRFSEEFISSFFCPFLEGIYLSPLEEQSSRMFHFVMKMFTVGLASLPRGGMQMATDQLEGKSRELDVEIQCGCTALSVKSTRDEDTDGNFLVEVDSRGDDKQVVLAKSIIIATDFNVTKNLLQDMEGIEQRIKQVPQRAVGCVYYGFRSPAPLSDPIFILNGEGRQRRNTKDFPINNVCFPSVVQRQYAPDGFELCSVAVLEKALSEHGDHASLDASIRNQLSAWFPGYASDIMDESKWVRKGVYVINNAQPAHYGTGGCANIHGGRDCSTFQGESLPNGVFLCGDHMATSTFDGALESGVNAGDAAARFLAGM